jgi:DNA-binding NtrC family response regulator
MNPANIAILFIDRYARYSSIERVLAGAGYRTRKATTARAAREMTAKEHFNIIVKSFNSGLSDGTSLMAEAARSLARYPIHFCQRGRIHSNRDGRYP